MWFVLECAMLTIFRRHTRRCPHTSRKERRCQCPLMVEGTLKGVKIRRALGLRSLEAAQGVVREWEIQGAIEKPVVRMEEACDRFYADAEARKVGPAQLGKYRLLKTELVRWFPERDVSAISVDDLRAYRESWELSPVSSGKKLERLRGFFRFCLESGWVKENPARLLKAPKVKQKPTMPFSSSEMEKILWATEVYPDRPKGRRAQVKAFVLLLRYSGLRIGDAVSLEMKRIQDGKLLLYTAKAGTPVWLPLPEEVQNALQRVANGDRFFWSGLGKLKSGIADWQRSLAKLFKLAGIRGHAHMFRDTLAVDLLSHGVTLENVAAILGNSLRIAEKHYAPWVKSRQAALEEAVLKVWREE